jgi:hypothetical protein
MIRADRIVQRRQWRDAAPPVFDREQKHRAAEIHGVKLEVLRTSWQEWRTEGQVRR